MWTINDVVQPGPIVNVTIYVRTDRREDLIDISAHKYPISTLQHKTSLARVNGTMRRLISLTRSRSGLGLSVAAHVRNVIWEVVNFLAHVPPSARRHAEDGQRARQRPQIKATSVPHCSTRVQLLRLTNLNIFQYCCRLVNCLTVIYHIVLTIPCVNATKVRRTAYVYLVRTVDRRSSRTSK